MGAEWWLWGAALATVLVAIPFGLLGGELLRGWGVHRLARLQTAHWTEQARVFDETNRAARTFRLWLVGGAAAQVLPTAALREQPGHALRFAALGVGLLLLVGDPLLNHWLARATRGGLPPVTRRQQLLASVVSQPSFWVGWVFAVGAPAVYDAWGVCWAAGFVVSLVLMARGGNVWLCRKLGGLRPADAERQAIVDRFAVPPGPAALSALSLDVPYLWVHWVPGLPYVLFGNALWPSKRTYLLVWGQRGAWLETPSARSLRLLRAASAFLTIGLVPIPAGSPLVALAVGCTLYLVAERSLRESASTRANVALGKNKWFASYVTTLQSYYRAKWVPVVPSDGAPLGFYDWAVQAGRRPTYPRPKPPSRLLNWGCGAAGLLVAYALVHALAPHLGRLQP